MISVIIPVYNEELALPPTLERVFHQVGAGDIEVIVVDGGSSDATRRIAEGDARIRLLDAPKGRASQMNGGAARARGEWLLFLHADTLLPENALEQIAALPERVAAGGFRHRFSGHRLTLRLISIADNIRCRSTRIIYGDQAMFVRRSLFERLGGFPALSRLEDVYFCEELVKITEPVLLESTVVTDSRKFVKHGVWRSLFRVSVILLCVKLGRPIPEGSLRFFEDVR
jgi:rSAM/selenodomain-associated transferase 2